MSTTPVTAAVDIGGTSIKSALLSDDHRTLLTLRHPTPHRQGARAVTQTVAGIVSELSRLGTRQGLDVIRVGVAAPGIVDDQRGHLVYSANLGLRDEPLAAHLTELLCLPVTLGHDVRAAALAEATLGKAGGRHLLLLALGTGIVGAFITDGRLVSSDGWAGEVGHLTVSPDGPTCACGGRGCLESLASARAIALAYSARTGGPVRGAAEVAHRLLDGDPDARDVWAVAVDALTTALAALTTFLGPDAIVIGGGLAEADELLLAPVRDGLDDRLTFQRRPTIASTVLGDMVGCVGAGILATRAETTTMETAA
ncbi:ROK family protein [Streptomyces sp. NPDC002262]|uniref:ROK family protein n=1 Tax=Streptomyces sp. NPDC002262 TaxID=3154414 RepID=UPI00332F8EE0